MKRMQAVMQLATTELETCLLTVDILRVTETQVFDNLDVCRARQLDGTLFIVLKQNIFLRASNLSECNWNQDHGKIQKEEAK
jgi:hypothetical protein